MKRDWWIYAAILLAIAAAFSQVSRFDFVNYDDPDYVTDNPHVRAGDVAWAFTSIEHANWFPVTWLSHMADVRLFGMDSGWHHLTNVAIHAATSLLLLALLLRITKDRWPSAFVAFVFAVHPLHVESIVWIAERKDVLCGFFYILALWAYVLYVERPNVFRYSAIAIFFMCGAMSKPMIVTMPFAALLLDWWPLQRFSRKSVMEKLPLIALSIVASGIAYVVQGHGGAVSSFDESPLSLRLENAAVSYVMYMFQFVWPAKLAVFYPFPEVIPAWQWIGALCLLAGITRVALRRAVTTVGWLWFLGTLVPVIGFVKIGLQTRADRYMYLPLIGLLIAIAWGVKQHKWLAIPAGVWFVMTFMQVATWRHSITLFEHAIAVTKGNYIAHNNLGVALRQAGRRQEAMSHFQEAIRLRARYPEAQNNLGEALLMSGQRGEAIPHILMALQLDPKLPEAHVNLGTVRHQQGSLDLAEAEYRTVLQLKPNSAEAHDGLAVILLETNRTADALPQALEAVALNPQDADGHYNLGRLYGLTGRTDESVAEFRETVRLQPQNAEAHFNLGVAQAQKNQLAAAINEFAAAIQARPDYVGAHFNRGSALARLERFDEAMAEFSEVLRLDPSSADARSAFDYIRSLKAGK